MARIIPNESTYVAFLTSLASGSFVPTAAEIAAGLNLTPFIISVNAATRGNVVSTPTFESRFETTIPGTVSATFEADMYRDNVTDAAWNALPRETQGYFVISRFGGHGAKYLPITGDKVEVWPIFVASRSATNLTSNTAQTFQVNGSVFAVPNESATVT